MMLASAALVASAACFSPPIRLIPARAPRLLLMSETAASKEAYAMLDALLKEAERGSGRGAAPARALRRRWLDLTPGELVESALILGVSIGVDFDRGLELLEVAEGETEAVPARGYSALMRLGVGAERHQEVLGLLARARAQDASSAGAILSAMQAAGALGDWGAVARLSDEYEGIPESEASRLEAVGSPEVLAELFGDEAGAAEPSVTLTRADGLAQMLALRAHCKRGDAARAQRTLERMRDLEVPLQRDAYEDLLALAKQGGISALLALRPVDLARSLGGEIEAPLLSVTNKPNELDNSEIELLYVGVALGFVGVLAFFVLSAQPPPADPLAF